MRRFAVAAAGRRAQPRASAAELCRTRAPSRILLVSQAGSRCVVFRHLRFLLLFDSISFISRPTRRRRVSNIQIEVSREPVILYLLSPPPTLLRSVRLSHAPGLLAQRLCILGLQMVTLIGNPICCKSNQLTSSAVTATGSAQSGSEAVEAVASAASEAFVRCLDHAPISGAYRFTARYFISY